MRTPLTYVLMRSATVLLVLGLLGLFGAGLAGAGPWSVLSGASDDLVDLFDRLRTSGVWR